MNQKQYYSSWLAGMIDGEGHISLRQRDSHIDRVVRVANTEQDLIDGISEACEALGIRHVVRPMHQKLDERHKKICYEVAIYGRESFHTLLDEVPIRSKRKRETLQRLVDSYKFPRRPSPEKLHEMYVTRGMTTKEMADELGVGGPTAWRWATEAGVKMRQAKDRRK